MNRPLCTVCQGNPCAVNYIAEEITHYRKLCSICARAGKKISKQPPAWQKTGYVKKTVCERCNFKSKSSKQMFVFHLDGNLKNNDWLNLKTVCANCRIEVNDSKTTWRQSILKADY